MPSRGMCVKYKKHIPGIFLGELIWTETGLPDGGNLNETITSRFAVKDRDESRLERE